ncbi:MAG: hypothetical protein GF308_07995 [Candidatus Heimdallarchaeota archaeon]|nr:hypothetical protein [Candidatus Heimdallarchaeota archaeon]
MNEKGFRKFCLENQIAQKDSDTSIQLVKEFEEFLQKNDKEKEFVIATPNDLRQFIDHLMATNRNSYENFVGLLRYSFFVEKEDIKIALFELLDGREVLVNLSKELKTKVGKQRSQQILERIILPPLGTRALEKAKTTKQLMEKLEAEVDEETCKEILVSGLHERSKESLLKARERFLQAKNIDDFLAQEFQAFIRRLEQHQKEGSLFYTQEIDGQVINYVKNNPTIGYGVREGNVIYATKIPYLTKQFLTETDEDMKRYYYCHCPWVREVLKKSQPKISPTFCYCSAGWYKQYWDVVLDQPIKVEVVETILKNDSQCKFAIHLPAEIVEGAEKEG